MSARTLVRHTALAHHIKSLCRKSKRISATRSRHEMTNRERQSLMDNLELRWTVCALLLKLVSSGAEVALSPRRSDEISPLFQSVFFVHSFHSCDRSFKPSVDATPSNFSCIAQ